MHWDILTIGAIVQVVLLFLMIFVFILSVAKGEWKGFDWSDPAHPLDNRLILPEDLLKAKDEIKKHPL